MNWTVVGVVCALILACSPLLFLLLRWELHKAFKAGFDPILDDLQKISDGLDRTHDHIKQAGLCVHDLAPQGRGGDQ